MSVKSYPHHPVADEYPEMSEAELIQLANDVKENGQKLPVQLYKGRVIDGRSRQRACAMADVPCRYQDYLGSEESLADHVASLNEHRRHLAPEWLKKRRQERVERVAAARRNGRSQRAIAEAEGVSRAQVRQDLQAGSTGQGCPVEPADGKVKGKDNRTRPAKRKKAAEPEQLSAEEQQQAGENLIKMAAAGEMPVGEVATPTDADGLPLPRQAVAAFEALPEVRKFCRAVDDLCAAAQRLAGGPCGKAMHLQSVVTHLKNAKNGVWQSRPAHVCPYCSGASKNCRACEGRGWVTVSTFKNAPKAGGVA